MQYPPHRPKIGERLFFLLSGAIISTPFPLLFNSLGTIYLRLTYPILTANFLSIAVMAPILEEFAKAYPLFYRHGETERSIFTLGFLTGLGFGIAEFFLYIFVFGAPVALRLPLILFHAASTSITAFGIGRYRAFAFYLAAVILHAVYNHSVLSSGNFNWITLFTFIFTLGLSWFFYKRTTERPIKYS